MPQVTNLAIKLQTGSSGTYYASWEFNKKTTTTTTTTTGIKIGSLVSIKAGATYYNGVAIPSWVMNQKWKVTQLSGDRAVLGENESGTNSICSPINTKYLVGATSSSTTTTTTTTVDHLDHYTVTWYYYTGDGLWFKDNSSDVKTKYATYNAPSNALKIKVAVKPVSKTHKVNDKDVSYWTGTSVSAKYSLSYDPPETPTTPTVVIEKYKLTASLENISDARTDEVQFEVYKGNKKIKSGIVKVTTRRATFSCSITAGEDYRVRCRAINLVGKEKLYGEWSEYSSSAETIPAAPKSILYIKALSETSVQLKWEKVSNATGCEVEYTTQKRYFDSSSEVSSLSVASKEYAEVTGLESGQEYFFRVRAVNDAGNSLWSEVKSIVIGKKPSAPTTWSSTTTAVTGESLILYWVHNSEDNSSQTSAELELYVNGTKEVKVIQNTTDEEEKDKTSSYTIATGLYIEGTTIQWRVRTAGITGVYGEWSVQRTIDVYAPAVLELSVTDGNGAVIDTLSAFPFYIRALAGPNTQKPIGYHVAIVANESYETVDSVGNFKMVKSGDQIYSKYFDTKTELVLQMSANHLDLENGVDYTVICTVSMNSGLNAEASSEFTVSWTDEKYEPNAEISVDKDSYSAYIRPYCIDDDENLVEDITLSVYRREFDGSFTELGTGISNTRNEFITDPHPALDYARYRIVAISKSTGAVGFYDTPGYPVGCTSVIIQWDEEWSSFETDGEDELEHPPWVGSLLELPYNIDITDSNSPDVSLVKYIGRSHPVSYYGTQIGSSAIWNMEIPTEDKDTLYTLHRLSAWMGDVYVREPSGSGYWASITVSFSQKHCELAVPITMNVTRVEGGV